MGVYGCVGIVGIAASLGMARIGFMDMVKSVALPVVVLSDVTLSAQSFVENMGEEQETFMKDDQSDEDKTAEEERMRKEAIFRKYEGLSRDLCDKGVFWGICQHGRQYDSKEDTGRRLNVATH